MKVKAICKGRKSLEEIDSFTINLCCGRVLKIYFLCFNMKRNAGF